MYTSKGIQSQGRVYMCVYDSREGGKYCIHPKAFKTTVLENALDGTLNYCTPDFKVEAVYTCLH